MLAAKPECISLTLAGKRSGVSGRNDGPAGCRVKGSPLAFPPKPKWTRRRTYQRIRNEIQALETKAKQTRFRKDIDIRTFAYHAG
jgi:hypothetical protein